MDLRDAGNRPAHRFSGVDKRAELIEEMYRRYGAARASGWLARYWRFLRKKCAWLMVVGGTKLMKRLLDIVVAAALLALLSPLLLLVALIIKAGDRGPVLFWQKRVGRWGREFQFPKFRSMIVDAEDLRTFVLTRNHHGRSVTFKMKDDPRVTPFGRILRKLSIDELPQLWCVLRGEMSLVGPRPPLPDEVERYTLFQRRRLDVTPGLTCIWQVSGRGDIPFPQQVELDLRYIESQSLLLDIQLLLKTVPAVLLGAGAY